MELTQLAGVEIALHGVDGRVEQEDVPDHEDQPALRREGLELTALADTHRERLLNQDVLASSQGPPGEVEVAADWCCDDNGIDVVIGECAID